MTTLKHKFPSGKAAAADPTLVDGPDWDSTHVFAGGSDGQVVTRDSAFDPPVGDGWKWSFILTAMLADLAVITTKLADLSVTTAKLADAAVTAAKIADGAVTAPKFRRFEGSAFNAALVTVLVGQTTIVDLDLGTVVAGDRILVFGTAGVTKGATGGTTELRIVKAAGTATISIRAGDLAQQVVEANHPAGVLCNMAASCVVKITAGGTLTLRLAGLSGGSSGTIPAGGGQIEAWVIPGS